MSEISDFSENKIIDRMLSGHVSSISSTTKASA